MKKFLVATGSVALAFILALAVIISGCGGGSSGGGTVTPDSTGGMNGFVTDSETGDSIDGATVTINDKSATTADGGKYSIDGISTGTHQIKIAKDGYCSDTQEVTIVKDETIDHSVKLAKTVVSGIVTYRDNPVEGAVVEIGEESYTTKSDGAYELKGIPQGEQQVTCTIRNFVSATITVTVDDCKATTGNFAWNWVDEVITSDSSNGARNYLCYNSSDNPRTVFSQDITGGLYYAEKSGAGWDFDVFKSGFNPGFVSLALTGNGNPWISYCDYTNNKLGTAYYDGANWSFWEPDSSGEYNSVIVDSNDVPHVAYYYNSGSDLKYTTYGGSSWATSTLESTGSTGAQPCIAVDGSDNLHISYLNFASGYKLKYVKITNGTPAVSTIDTDGSVGQYSSIDVDSDNYPHISYRDSINTSLKYIMQDVSGWHAETVDADHDPDQTSLKVNSFDCALVIYHNESDLFFARWNGSQWVKETLVTGNVDNQLSLALNSADYPGISYYNSSTETAHYLRLELEQ